MGQRGIATSFYTERDEPIASVLVRTLMETKQDIPEFLEPFKPTGKGLENLKFETESDFDPEEAGIAHLGGGGWGGDEAGGDAGGDWGGDAGGDAGGWGGGGDDAGGNQTTEAPAWGASAGGDGW